MKKQYLFLSLGALLIIAGVAAAFPVLAQDYGLGATAGAAGLKNEASVATLIGNIIGTALSMIAVIFFILMVYGGFLWMTARGKDDQVNKAKESIIAAIIGLIIVLASYAITTFVFDSVNSSGSNPAENCESANSEVECLNIFPGGGDESCAWNGEPGNPQPTDFCSNP